MSILFLRLNWVSLILIYLVIIAGSFVRVSGSGMGCPDWPKCFGKWVPPTSVNELPKNYKEIYGEKRVQKVEKFCKILRLIGMEETAEKIKSNPQTYEELPFNAPKTWIEYVNRLAGFLAGNAVLLIFLWTIFAYRKNKRFLIFALLNLIILTFQAWFGSIVVATNLVPWTITVHLFLALVIVLIQLYLLHLIPRETSKKINLPKYIKATVLIVFLITTFQMFLGTQVRESIDFLTKSGFSREEWSSKLSISFFIHRSFSWLVLAVLSYLLYWNFKNIQSKRFYWIYGILALELIGGVLLAYAEMPGFVQISHLLFATILFGMLFVTILQSKMTEKK